MGLRKTKQSRYIVISQVKRPTYPIFEKTQEHCAKKFPCYNGSFKFTIRRLQNNQKWMYHGPHMCIAQLGWNVCKWSQIVTGSVWYCVHSEWIIKFILNYSIFKGILEVGRKTQTFISNITQYQRRVLSWERCAVSVFGCVCVYMVYGLIYITTSIHYISSDEPKSTKIGLKALWCVILWRMGSNVQIKRKRIRVV